MKLAEKVLNKIEEGVLDNPPIVSKNVAAALKLMQKAARSAVDGRASTALEKIVKEIKDLKVLNL